MQVISNLLWLFFIYSFLGWIFETILGTIKQKKFTNKGLVTGPFCVIYGFAAVLITIVLRDLSGIWLFLFAAVYATAIEWIAGHLIERFFGERWWDYSKIKANLDGYICLPASVLWGALGFVIMRWGNSLCIDLVSMIPGIVEMIILIVISACMVIDILASSILLSGKTKHPEKWARANDEFDKVSKNLGKRIGRYVDKRIHKAYPKTKKMAKDEHNKEIFAYGCSFYKIVLLFFIAAFLGDITETLFCRITAGVWMSRSSVVWGPFSIVWGLAIALGTMMIYKYKDRDSGFLFWTGTLLGGVFEYLCSVFTEVVFGKVFWDYSHMPFNLGGRINLLYCFFWGIATVVWFKGVYPHISRWIEKIPKIFGTVMTWILILFMICNIVMSCMALIRYDERDKDPIAYNAVQMWLDEHYNDEKMAKIYQNAKSVD